VTEWPLALCDANTLDLESDLQPMDTVFPHGCIESYTIHHNPHQQWHYVSEQSPFELWVFNTADTTGLKPGQYSLQCTLVQHANNAVAHCAFQNVEYAALGEPRESIEFRLFAVYQ
jgi:hypothetical protein